MNADLPALFDAWRDDIESVPFPDFTDLPTQVADEPAGARA